MTVLFSGGIDSSSCVHLLKTQGFEVRGIFVNFGQASAAREAAAVDVLQDILGIEVDRISASARGEFVTGELIGRNSFLIFSALLLGRCYDGLLALGIHAGTPYFDCSPAFVERIDPLVRDSTDGRLGVIAPFLGWQKDDVYSYFLSSGLPLSSTYSCEAGTIPPCGSCASCKDRIRIECQH